MAQLDKVVLLLVGRPQQGKTTFVKLFSELHATEVSHELQRGDGASSDTIIPNSYHYKGFLPKLFEVPYHWSNESISREFWREWRDNGDYDVKYNVGEALDVTLIDTPGLKLDSADPHQVFEILKLIGEAGFVTLVVYFHQGGTADGEYPILKAYTDRLPNLKRNVVVLHTKSLIEDGSHLPPHTSAHRNAMLPVLYKCCGFDCRQFWINSVLHSRVDVRKYSRYAKDNAMTHNDIFEILKYAREVAKHVDGQSSNLPFPVPVGNISYAKTNEMRELDATFRKFVETEVAQIRQPRPQMPTSNGISLNNDEIVQRLKETTKEYEKAKLHLTKLPADISAGNVPPDSDCCRCFTGPAYNDERAARENAIQSAKSKYMGCEIARILVILNGMELRSDLISKLWDVHYRKPGLTNETRLDAFCHALSVKYTPFAVQKEKMY
jgi:hypothetical protein